MSHEKPHTDEARKSVHRNCMSADASAFDLFSIVGPMGATRHTGCSLPPRAPACNLLPHLVARHVTIAFQLYSDCTFCVFLQKNPCFFTFSTFLFLSSVIE